MPRRSESVNIILKSTINDPKTLTGPFSFRNLLYLYEYNSPVGASVFAGVFLVARDLREKTLTSVNENRNQNRKLNRPEDSKISACIKSREWV